MQRNTIPFVPSWVSDQPLTKEQIISNISSLLTKNSTKIAVLSLSTNLLYSWRDAFYSTNSIQIDHVIQIFTRLNRELYLLDHLIDILTSEYHGLYPYNYAILWMDTDLTRRSVRLAWRCSIVNWLIGIQRKNNMKVEVTQHAVRLIDTVDTLQGRNERSYQLRAMAFFILAAKFHNRTRIRMEEFSRYSANAFEPREIGDCMRTVYHEINFEIQLPLANDFLELYLELNSTDAYPLNTSKIRALGTLFIHIACIQSWSSCFNASLLASSVLLLCLKYLQETNSIPYLCSLLWLYDYSVDIILGLAGYIALIASDIPDMPTDRSNHYFYAHKLYNDDIRHETDDRFQFHHVKKFCRNFIQTSDINCQISRGMQHLVFKQIRLYEQTSPTNHFKPSKSNCSIQFTIQVVLAAKRFAKHIFQRRKLLQQLTSTTLID